MGAAKLHLCAFYARETITAMMLAALFLVTGCSSKDNYTPNASLAPPPPFMASVQSFGPPVPAEIAMVQMMNTIMPAAGDGFPNEEMPAVSPRKCLGFASSDQGRVGVGFGGPVAHDGDHGFANLHSGGQMTVQFTFSLPSPAHKNFSCR